MMKETQKETKKETQPVAMPEPILVIPCIDPGLSCCRHQLLALNEPAKTVRRCMVYCKSWRQNHSKDGTIYGCRPAHPVSPVIIAEDSAKFKLIPGYMGPPFL